MKEGEKNNEKELADLINESNHEPSSINTYITNESEELKINNFNKNEIEILDSNYIELKNIKNLNTKELINAIKFKISSSPIHTIKAFIDESKKIFYERSNKEYKEQFNKYKTQISESENYNDKKDLEFEYLYPYTNEFKAVLSTYKIARDKYYSEQEKIMKQNLKVKLSIIEELKKLINGEEKIKETFSNFKNIQARWKNAGQVPKSELNNIWKTYNHHVENFFDYLKINNDLRDIEFKRNLDKKNKICELTENLDKLENVEKAFSKLQKYHDKWKEIGPVGKINRQEIWERFQTATKIIHKKKNDFYQKRKEIFDKNFHIKINLCEKIEKIDFSKLNHHNSWQNISKNIEKYKEDWKKIGPVARNQNYILWNKFISAIKLFNREKNNFYKKLKKHHQNSIDLKLAIVEKAEILAENTDWKNTSDKLKNLQRDWNKSGIGPRKETDKLWNRFKKASDTFFDNLRKQNEIEEKQIITNLVSKKEFLEKVVKFKVSGDGKKDFIKIKEFINDWGKIGKVPRKNIKFIEGKFRTIIDNLFKDLDINKSEIKQVQFKSKIQSILAERNKNKLNDELLKIKNGLKKGLEELSILENNISFFKHTKDNNPMVLGVIKNIKNQKEKIKELKAQMAYIKNL